MKNLILFLFLLNVTLLPAQDECGFDPQVVSMSMNIDSRYSDFEENYREAFATESPSFSGSYDIPVIVHVLHNGGVENITDAQIVNGIDFTNDILNGNDGLGIPTDITLELLCIKRIEVQETSFSSRPNEAQWRNQSFFDRLDYLNVYIVPAFNGANTRGVASHPVLGPDGFVGEATSSINDLPLGDGVAVRYDHMGVIEEATSSLGLTLVHEVGHYLGLYHVNGLSMDCNNNCSDQDKREDFLSLGDRVGDTTPSFWNGFNSWCNTPKIDPCVGTCTGAIGDGSVFPSENLMTSATDCRESFTQGQIDRMHFTLESYRQGLVNVIYRCQDIALTNDFTFEPGDHFVGTVTVGSGSTLTIPAETTLMFCDGAKLIVEAGGTVYNHGKLTTSCQQEWNGVEVIGTGATYVGMQSSTVENAFVGISVKQGASCVANATAFLNNTVSIEANHNSDGVVIEDCIFDVDGDYRGENFAYHVRVLSNEKQVKIRGGQFLNKLESGTGQAIHSYNGNFTVAPHYGDVIHSERVRFEGFDHAIHATNGITHSYQIEDCLFSNNNIGIYNNEVNASKITFCDFVLQPDQVGVMYHGPTVGIINQENNYRGFTDDGTVGVVSKSIGTMNNTIRRNSFRDLQHGCLANGLNGVGGLEIDGLTFLCNDNDNVEFDHAVVDDPYTDLDQIRPVQADLSGDGINATGNVLYYDATPGSDFFNDGDLAVEYHSRDIENERLVSALNTTEIEQPLANVDCSQSIFIDYPPVITDPTDPKFPGDLIGMKEAIETTRGNVSENPPSAPTTTPTETTYPTQLDYEQEEWDHFLPFLLNEVMTGSQYAGYDGYSDGGQLTSIPTHVKHVLSWIDGHSLEGDLTYIRTLVDYGQIAPATAKLNTLVTKWRGHPEVNTTVSDYSYILSVVGQDISNLPPATVTSLVSDYNTIQSGSGRAWIRSIADLYDQPIDVSYTLTYANGSSPRSGATDKKVTTRPNPFATDFILTSEIEGFVYIYDMLGRLVGKHSLVKGDNAISLDHNKSGLYIFEIKANDIMIHSGKIIKL